MSLGRAMTQSGDIDEAVTAYSSALRIRETTGTLQSKAGKTLVDAYEECARNVRSLKLRSMGEASAATLCHDVTRFLRLRLDAKVVEQERAAKLCADIGEMLLQVGRSDHAVGMLEEGRKLMRTSDTGETPQYA